MFKCALGKCKLEVCLVFVLCIVPHIFMHSPVSDILLGLLDP